MLHRSDIISMQPAEFCFSHQQTPPFCRVSLWRYYLLVSEQREEVGCWGLDGQVQCLCQSCSVYTASQLFSVCCFHCWDPVMTIITSFTWHSHSTPTLTCSSVNPITTTEQTQRQWQCSATTSRTPFTHCESLSLSLSVSSLTDYLLTL